MRNAEDTPPDGFARVDGPPGPVSSPPARPPRRPTAPWGPAPQPPGAAPYERPVHVPSRPIPAKGHHPACGQLLPGPVRYHRRRMIRYCQRARCLRRSQRPASRTRLPSDQVPSGAGYHSPPTGPAPAGPAPTGPGARGPGAALTGAGRAPFGPHRRRAGLNPVGGSRIRGAGRPGPPRPAPPPGRGSGLPLSVAVAGATPRDLPAASRVRRAGPDPLCARADLPGGRDRMGLARITRRRQRRRARRRRAAGRRRRPAALAAPRGRTARQPAAVR